MDMMTNGKLSHTQTSMDYLHKNIPELLLLKIAVVGVGAKH